MSGSIVGKIIASIILVVLCFILGVQAADDAKMSLMILSGLIGLFFVLVLGPRCWVLIFLLPPVLNLFPIYLFQKVNAAYYVGAAVLVYWLLMWGMGYVKVRWRSMIWLDSLIPILVGLMIVSFIRNPVTIHMLGLENDNIGGAAYIVAIFAVVYYLTLSIIPISYTQAYKVLNWQIWLGLACAFVMTGIHLAGFNAGGGGDTLGEAIEGSRFSTFQGLGRYGLRLFLSMLPLAKILTSPVYLFGCFGSFLCLAFSGGRMPIVCLACEMVVIAFVRKEMTLLIVLGSVMCGGLLMLSACGALLLLPYGVQRILSMAPMLKVDAAARGDAEGSADWRVVMWEWAMDPRTGYIKDYVWGDGFGMSLSGTVRNKRAIMRGEARYGDQDAYAERGLWHSTWITTVHRLGFVGLAVQVLYELSVLILIIRLCMSTRGSPLYVLCLFYLIPSAVNLPLMYFGTGSVEHFFKGMQSVALLKLLYCIAREQGLIIPWTQRRRYVPLMIQDHGQRIKPDLP